jgi:hypothetical protein
MRDDYYVEAYDPYYWDAQEALYARLEMETDPYAGMYTGVGPGDDGPCGDESEWVDDPEACEPPEYDDPMAYYDNT